MTYQGSFFALLNPFALLCGLVSVAMLIMHGGLYLAVKTEGALHKRAVTAARLFGLLTIILFASAGLWVSHLEGYTVLGQIAPQAAFQPLALRK